MAKLTCNIDRPGRVVRAISGVVFLGVGLVLGLGYLGIGTLWIRIAIGVVLGLFGVFQLFEARAGWCVVRAMGGKTPI